MSSPDPGSVPGKHSDLKEGDRLIIEVVEPKKRYRLYVEQ